MASSKDAAKLTPMMERYMEVKSQNPGSLLLFRMGDFYELFHEDAEIASKVLGLTLTSRDKNSANPTAMAGFPYHALENYLHKLIRAGHRAAICDQVEDPKTAKGLVRREVTQVVTPGTLTDEALLDPRTSNYLASVFVGKKQVGLSWLELSTGRFFTADIELAGLADELARLRPAELLVSESPAHEDELWPKLQLRDMLVTRRPPWSFAADNCQKTLLKHFGLKTLEGFDLEPDTPGIVAAGALLEYVHETQKSSLTHIVRLEPWRQGRNLIIDEATRASLELTRTLRGGGREGSLLDIIDETVSPMGARLLAEWLSNPLIDIGLINARLDAVEELTGNTGLCRDLREELGKVYDLQRLTAKVATLRASPRDLGCLARTLALLPKLKAKLAGRASNLLQLLETDLDLCAEVRADIDTALADDPPLLTTDGGMIRQGYNGKLDELRELAKGGKAWIAKYQAEEIQRTGITNLKVGFNRVFGYYLEVSGANRDKVPDDYIRKQTLKNQERFITPQLKEYEEKVLRAEDESKSLEQELFSSLRDRVAKHVTRLKNSAEVIAEIDVLAALATLAVTQGYSRPQMTEEPILDIREGRHPVLDKLQPTGEFVPNDALLGGEHHGRVQIITGPNMAGKSTYIRQAALLTLMAQMGSFVPASEARIGIADRVFARVGASDELGKGQSTFMVEMTETARILNTATARSLVILDEIGRGTSTYDGISLAWAVTEYLHDVLKSRTLFATHYHELTDLTSTLKHASNWNVAVHEQGDGIIFLHRIVEGAADKSYGIHVARLAGVPRDVVDRAAVILKTLEDDHLDESGKPTVPTRPTKKSKDRQLSLFVVEEHPVFDEIRQLKIEEMTPLAALAELNRLRDKLNQ
ncbi:MAG: DNA mismatch repair protein MutS [Planctomycetota bacterium]|nr:DNA mismatch repair protein MutS [Planctomycetota bacterium]